MNGLDADRLMNLLARLVLACEQIASHIAPAISSSGRGGRNARQPIEAAGAAVELAAEGPQLPQEVGTAQAAEILGVSKDTVLLYREKGLLPYRDLAPPDSTRPIYMYPLDAVIELRTSYRTEEPAPDVPLDPPRRRVKGRRQFKHLVIDEDA